MLKKIIPQIALLLLLSTNALSYDLVSTTKTGIVEKLSMQFLGIISSLAVHEVGHISSLEYAGGDFIEFGAPYDNVGIPTLWMDGSRSQVGLASMMGNNASILSSSWILNSDIKKSDFIDGYLAFGLFNPISYSLDRDGVDFNTASDSMGIGVEKLRVANLIPASFLALKAISNNKYDFYGEGVLDIAFSSNYIKVSNNGTIQTTQQYWADDSDNLDVNLNYAVKIGNYYAGIGNRKYGSYSSESQEYFLIKKDYRTANGTLTAQINYGNSLDYEINFSAKNLFVNHNSANGKTVAGLTVSF